MIRKVSPDFQKRIHTEIGKIGKALGTIAEEDSLLKKETDRLVKNFAVIGSR